MTQTSLRLAGNAQVAVPELPTQIGPHGIRFDFNEGCRVLLPETGLRVELHDLDTHSLLFNQIGTAGGMVVSSKKYFIRFGIKVWRGDELIFAHNYDAADRPVLARMEVGGLGDQIAWIGHAAAFAAQHRCRLTCVVKRPVIALFQDAYPHLRFVTVDEVDANGFYATYKLFIFYNDHNNDWQPTDYRQTGLCRTAAYMLGLPVEEKRPAIVSDSGGPPITEPYVVIATQATTQNKYWNNPHGWRELVVFLKSAGYRVVCIDLERTNGRGMVWNHMPHGVEDQTGNRPLTERVRWLRHAAFFVGLSSGLSWLAWAAHCPVVLISGFTHPINEFYTPYRVINYNVCNSCSNDIRLQLDPSDFLWCPRHKDTARMFECGKSISVGQVKAMIRTIPHFLGNGGTV
ncbi:autotransporter strand-loop-strand O-heptosyltransferase [Acidisoma cellulosilytica]|uniref:Autotransporter strand-loop-strand O-heptosyltransferase n=2 Tax=Acidisoma cellulosilyticum TaxID=2802395 RepID=A0A963Z4F5_9PROT|nr:autotransporter strand-loop-strand O-heptosyltransferase [Acidisoma cellulosilyticum]